MLGKNNNQLDGSYSHLVYSIFNSLKECSPYCGSMYRLYPISAYDEILSELLSMIETATNSTEDLIIPKADEILMSFPICSFNSSLGQTCKTYDKEKRQSVRIFTNQMIQKINLRNTASTIETESWLYSISEVEKNKNGFSFIFTDDGKFGTYLSSVKYFANFDPGHQLWRIVGEELIHLSGPEQQKVGKYVIYDTPITLNIN